MSALLLLIGGGAGCVTGLVLFFVVGLAWLLGTVSYDTPVHVDIDCGSGLYYVFEQTGSQVTGPGFSFTHDQAPNLIPDQVQVIGPLQTPLRTWLADGSETITKGSQIYTNAVGFDVTVPGRYSVSIVSTSPVAVLIAPSLGGQFARAAPWLILVAIGFCVAVVGLVLLIVDRSRRRKAATAVGPPQWHPA